MESPFRYEHSRYARKHQQSQKAGCQESEDNLGSHLPECTGLLSSVFPKAFWRVTVRYRGGSKSGRAAHGEEGVTHRAGADSASGREKSVPPS